MKPRANAPLPPLLGPAGEAALQAVVQRRPLLAFDFDGTLTPIVARPDDAHLAPAVADRLRRLATRLPVAIVTGRSVADVQGRLGFQPHYIAGNHGAESTLDALNGSNAGGSLERIAALEPLRLALGAKAAALADAGVRVEDKQQSLALHYRQATNPLHARALIERLIGRWVDGPEGSLRAFGGKLVVNVISRQAPDKADAVRTLLRHSGAGGVLFAGDDLNDEPVFASAPVHWLTVRIGRDDFATSARWALDGPQHIGAMLDRLLAALAEAA